MKVATGIFLAGATVAAIVIAERHMRARQRRSYRPGSGRRDALPTPPAVRSMTRAHHINPYRDHLDPPRNPTTSPTGPGTTSSRPATNGGSAGRPRARPILPVGMRNNRPVTLDLAHGVVAFTGPGSGDVVRAVIATVLSGATDTTPAGRIIMSTAEADELLGPHHTTRPQPTGAVITTDLAASLASATTAARSDHTAQPGAGEQMAVSPVEGGPIVLIINAMRPQQADDARATLAELTAAGVGVLILGEHPDAGICDVDSEHIVSSVYGPAVAHLDGVHLFNLALDYIDDTFSPLTPTPTGHPDRAERADWPDNDHPAHGPHDHNGRDHNHGDRDGDGGGDDDGDSGVGGVWAPWELRLAGPADDFAELEDTAPDQTQPYDDSSVTSASREGWHDGLIREIGTRDGLPLHYDLGAFAGLGLTGLGAPGAVRALWIQLLTLTPTNSALTTSTVEVIIPIDTADALVGQPELPEPHATENDTSTPDTAGHDTHELGRHGGGVVSEDEQLDTRTADEVVLLGWPGEVQDLDTALHRLETDIEIRTHEQYVTQANPTTARKPIVLITLSPEDLAPPDVDAPPAGTTTEEGESSGDGEDPDAVVAGPGASGQRIEQRQEWARKLREVSERGASVGVAVIVLGHWAHGTTCHVDETGRVSAPRGAGGFLLRDATLAQLDPSRTRAVFDHGILPPPPEHVDDSPFVDDSLIFDETDDGTGDDTALTQNPTSTAGEDQDEEASPGQDLRGPRSTGEVEQAQAAPRQSATTANDETGSSESEQPDNDTRLEPHHRAENSGTSRSAAMLPPTEPIPTSMRQPPLTPDPDRVSADALLVILVLGPLAVFARSAPGEPLLEITGRLSPTQRLILAALAASTEPVHTEKLLGMCFSNTGGADPVHRLHSHLSRLRTVLRHATGGNPATRLIAHTAERYHFTNACWVDNHTLHAQLRTNTTDPDQTATQSAFALYRGPLLDGLEYDTDTDWLSPQREHTLRTIIDLARQLADHLTDTQPAQAATYLAAALHLDPYNEDTAQHLIAHHLAHGHRHAAHHTLTQLTQHLAEIGETPRPETVALLDTPREHTRP